MPPRLLVPAALATIYVVWGSTYLAIRVMVEDIPPLLGASVRYLLAGAVVWLYLRLRNGREGVRVSARELAGCAVVGVLLLIGGNGLVTIAEQDVPSGLAALLIASEPLFIVLLRWLARERPSQTTVISVVVGFAGVALLVLPGERPEGAPLGGVLLVLAAAALWALGSFASPRLTLPDDAFLSTAVQMLVGGALMALMGLAAGEAGGLDPAAVSADSLLALLYLASAGSVLAFSAYVWLLQNAPISTVSTYAYVNPVIAIFLGWLILSEEITPFVVAGATVIVASVAVVVRHESAPAEEPVAVHGEEEAVAARERAG
jgi:drug/metabolite transporter (DMT)-like permease